MHDNSGGEGQRWAMRRQPYDGDSRQAAAPATASCPEKFPAGIPGLPPEWPLIINLMTTWGTSHHTAPATPSEIGTYCHRVWKALPDHPTSASPDAGTAGLAQSAALCEVTAWGTPSPSAMGATHLLAWRADKYPHFLSVPWQGKVGTTGRLAWERLKNRDRTRMLPSTSLRVCSSWPETQAFRPSAVAAALI